METILKLKNNGSNLGLRELGKQIGLTIRETLAKGESIILDFEKVDSISSSFADELIAKVMFEIGQEKFLSLVKIRNTNNFVKTMINSSILKRLQQQSK